MRPIGFSHGVAHKVTDVSKPETIEAMHRIAPGLIEVNFHRVEQFEGILPITDSAKAFAHRILHMPCYFDYGLNGSTVEVLEKSASLYKEVGAELALVHPDLVSDWRVFDGSPMTLAVENMDNRKKAYRSVDEMKRFFADHDAWKMVLDLNHCFANDPTMGLAQDFIDALKPRIAEIHLSGFAGFHEPLFRTKQLEILDFCRQLPDTPIVIESVMESMDDLAREYAYVVENLGE
jgi:hypothetical protein